MASKYRRGFKKQAEELSITVREEMGLHPSDALDPRALANHVKVPIVELRELVSSGLSEESLRHLLGKGKKEFSAALFEFKGKHLIVANPSHSKGRQASDLAHEVAHYLLKHKAFEAVLECGCRRCDPMVEREADWLAGELLVPRQAALSIARNGENVAAAARRYGVSVEMMRWRLNGSGAVKQARHEKNAGRRRS